LLHSAEGRNLTGVHAIVGAVVLAANLGVGVWGGLAWLRGSPSVWFWYALRAAQAVVVVQVTLGFVLLSTDHRALDDLHYVYGMSPLLITLFSEGMRAGAGQRVLGEVDDIHALEPPEQLALARKVAVQEMGVMAMGALLIATLSLRALATGG
jgi:hypothetical protein